MKYSLVIASLICTVLAATIPSEPWTTLTPSASAPSGAKTDYASTFGINIVTVSASGLAGKKRDGVAQIGDGQVQKQTSITLATPTTAAVVNQITDGQVQHQTTAAVVNQITDGQVQHQTTAAVVNQITDGQVQHQTTAAVVNQITDGQVQHQTTAAVVNQITDGQIQHQTTAAVVNQITDGQVQHQTTAKVVNQITDGQVQHQTTTVTTASVANQITDGQVQHATTLTTATTASGAAQATDGQVQASATAAPGSDSLIPEACSTSDSLAMTLKGSVLTDSHGRIGAIVANRQFQFDGPPPQAGSIYAAGWSVTADGYLALGDSDIFYQCLSGDFFNLYDKSIGGQCSSVHLSIIDLIKC